MDLYVRYWLPTAGLHKPPEGVRVDLDSRQRRDAPCGSVADQRGKHEINGCRQFDPGPVGRLARRGGQPLQGLLQINAMNVRQAEMMQVAQVPRLKNAALVPPSVTRHPRVSY
jgi:hypothetical protein